MTTQPPAEIFWISYPFTGEQGPTTIEEHVHSQDAAAQIIDRLQREGVKVTFQKYLPEEPGMEAFDTH